MQFRFLDHLVAHWGTAWWTNEDRNEIADDLGTSHDSIRAITHKLTGQRYLRNRLPLVDRVSHGLVSIYRLKPTIFGAIPKSEPATLNQLKMLGRFRTVDTRINRTEAGEIILDLFREKNQASGRSVLGALPDIGPTAA